LLCLPYGNYCERFKDVLMIERSHRRKTPKTKPDPETLLRLHERLASQRLWFFRLFIASSIALVVSFILWLTSVPLTWRLLSLALGFVAGLFVQRSMKTWALAWIRDRAGLSYETALEQSIQKDNQKDDFGFSDSLKERAVEEASRLTLPTYQAWWLPMLALALGLAFLPLIPSITNLPSPLTTQPTAPTLPETANQTANTVEPSQTSQPVAEPPPDGQAPSQSPGETDTSQLSDAAGSSATSNNAQTTDEQALDRFLENLRQNEQAQEQGPDVDLSSVMQPSGNRSGQPSDEDRASRPRSEQTNPFSQTGEGESSEGQQGQQGASENEGEEGQDEQAREGQGQEDGEQQDAAQLEEDAAAQNTEASREGSGEQGGGQQDQEEQGQREQDQGEQGQEGSGNDGLTAEQGLEQLGSEQSDSGQNAQGAGSLPGAATEGTTEVTGSSQQNPDFLPGQVGAGPNNVAGTARLPGETEQLSFPEGSAPTSFSRAEEEALTEGRIPLEYQEVIRNYFRGE
jgi:hypothetical protein